MSALPLRFLHASDFHLEEPLAAVGDAPKALRSRLVDAAYHAARGLFDAAIAQQVDFLLLTGDIVDPRRCGPRGLAFLAEQFDRLAAKEIAVYWLFGEADAANHWPDAMEFPSNVHLFGVPPNPTVRIHRRGGQPIARILLLDAITHRASHGWTPAANGIDENTYDLHSTANVFFTIALARCTEGFPASFATQLASEADSAQRIDYLALGGTHSRKILSNAAPWIIQAGAIQGRSFAESGPHGATLVEVDTSGHMRVALRATDVARWHEEPLSLDDSTSTKRWQSRLGERAAMLAAEAGDRVLLLRVKLVHGSHWMTRSHRERLAADMLAWLRDEYAIGEIAKGQAPVWTVAVESEPAPPPEAWREEQTILGEFLRTVAELDVHADTGANTGIDAPNSWPSAAADARLPDELLTRLQTSEPHERTRLLAEVAELGAELLGGGAGDDSATQRRADRHVARSAV